MVDYDILPIDIESPSAEWFSTYRYEPFLKKWFFVEPDMHGSIVLLETQNVPAQVLDIVEKVSHPRMFAYCAPLKLQVQLNKLCNYRCKMCYAYDKNRPDEQLSIIQIKNLINNAKNAGIIRLNYVGGEVFMRKDFPEIVETTIENRLLVSCITNGIIPGMFIHKYQSVLDRLFNIQVSCNGYGSSYEYEYGCADWKKASKFISNTITNTSTNILSYVVSENNYLDIPRFLEFANSIKPTVIKFGTICWAGKSNGVQTIRYYKSILPKAKYLIEKGREKYSCLKIQSQLDKGVNTPLWEDYSNGYRPFEFYFSPEGKDGLYIKSNGELYPFPLLSNCSEFILGTYKDDLKYIWQYNPILTKIRNVRFESSECGKKGCTEICGLWNRSYAYSWTGDIYGKIPCAFTNWE